MTSVNEVTLLGNLGRDPELKYTASGKAVLSFSLATSKSWKDQQSGEWKEAVQWHNCTAWERAAENLHKSISKGSKLYVKGELQTDTYEKEGQKHYSTKIIVREYVLLDAKPQSDRATGQVPSEVEAPEDDQTLPF